LKYLSALLLGALLCSCSIFKKTEPKIPVIVAPVETTPVIPYDPAVAIKQIEAIAENSACAKYKWKDRGVAPRAYIKGMAVTYARSVCSPNPVTASTTLGLKDKDALKNYGLEASNINAQTLLIGLGMRESSGKHCEGRDATASNTSADSAEAGMFQTSFDSRAANPELIRLYREFYSGARKCHLETFSQGVTCPSSDWRYWGTGEGVNFQRLAKECPAFAVEYAGVTIRTIMRHYGPLRTMAAEFKSECKEMLANVEETVLANKHLCDDL
jgi:hypothetical protein